MQQPIFEAQGEWRLKSLPDPPEAWMVMGRVYLVVLRRWTSHSLPEAEVRDAETGAVVGRYSWRAARRILDCSQPRA